MSVFPKTEQLRLRWVIVVLCFLYLAEIVGCFHKAYVDNAPGWILGACLWCLLAVGLWQLRPFARVLALILHWFLLVMTPLAFIFQVVMKGYLLGHFDRHLWPFLAFIAVFSILNAYAVKVLTQHRDQFRASITVAT
jgi:hypothetical protein